MIVAFGSAYFGVRHEPGAAVLFTLSLGLFTGSLITFAREVRVALNHLEFGRVVCRGVRLGVLERSKCRDGMVDGIQREIKHSVARSKSFVTKTINFFLDV